MKDAAVQKTPITAADLSKADRTVRELGRGALAHVRGAGDSNGLKYKYV